MPSWVYVLTNEAAPGLVKVGYTNRSPEDRARELAATGLPLPYIVAFAVECENARVVEQAVHGALAKDRVGKEWFRCSVKHARLSIRLAIGQGESDSPLAPGHSLEDYFPKYSTSSPSKATQEPEYDGPLPPGHPLRDLL